MRVRQLVGQQAGEIVEIPYAQATALLATGQVIHPWEQSAMVGGPKFEPEPMPEHLVGADESLGEALARQGLPDTRPLVGGGVAEPKPKGAKGAKATKDEAADPSKPALLGEDAPKGETSRGEKAAETKEAEQAAKGGGVTTADLGGRKDQHPIGKK